MVRRYRYDERVKYRLSWFDRLLWVFVVVALYTIVFQHEIVVAGY